jgi:DNA-binding response OmpR family regulator
MTDPREKVVVLVADDEPSTLALVSSHVRSRGYKVLEASDGDQAWQLAYENLPDLVILDVMMPGMSGWEVCRKIREVVSLAHTGVIMLTGIGENLNEMTSPLYGADEYIDKPFEFADLDKKIERTLDERSRGEVGRPDVETSARDVEPEPERAHGDGSNGVVKVSRTRPRKAIPSQEMDDGAFGDEPDPVTQRRQPSPERVKAKPKAKAAKKSPPSKVAAAKATAAPMKKASGKKPAATKKAAPKAAKAGAKAATKGAKVKVKASPAKGASKAKAAPKKAAKPAKAPVKIAAKPAAKGGKRAPAKPVKAVVKASKTALRSAAKGAAKAAKATAKAAPAKSAAKTAKATAKAAPAKSAAKTSKPARGSRSAKIQSDGPPAG